MVLGIVRLKMLSKERKNEEKRKKEKKILYIYQYNTSDILSGQRKPALQCVRNT